MTDRVKRLRQESVETRPYISSERAELITDFYASGEVEKHSVPVARALAFRYLIEHRTIYIGEGELIVGERGPAPKATPTYPELCCHSLQDLEILNSREKIRFAVSVELYSSNHKRYRTSLRKKIELDPFYVMFERIWMRLGFSDCDLYCEWLAFFGSV